MSNKTAILPKHSDWRLSAGLYLLTALAGMTLLLWVYTVSHRVAYPFELEWIEGSTANHVLRLLQGKPLFVAPSLEFTPNIYTPLFYYLGAASSWVWGEGFASLRMVSVLASAGTMALIGGLVYRETHSRWAAFIAATFYAGCYGVGGAWMDIARVDAVFLFFLMAAIYGLRDLNNKRDGFIFVLCLLLAYFSKQSALIAAVILLTYQFFCKPVETKTGWIVITFCVLLGGSLWFINHQTDGWFWFYTVEVPRGHPTNRMAMYDFFVYDVLFAVPIAFVFAVCFLRKKWLAPQGHRDLYFPAIFLAMGITAFFTRINQGGYSNNTLPLYAVLAVFFGIYIHGVLDDAFQISPGKKMAVLVFACLQLLGLFYSPGDLIPGQEDRMAWEKVKTKLQAIDGNIYAYESGNLGHLVGKDNFTHGTAFYDLRLSSNKDVRIKEVPASPNSPVLMPMLDAYNVKAIVLDERQRNVGRTPKSALGPFQFKEHLLPNQPDAMWPKSGAAIRPVLLYVRE